MNDISFSLCLSELLSRSCFVFQYENALFGARGRTYLCFIAQSDEIGATSVSGYFCSTSDEAHAEMRFLDYLKTSHRGHDTRVACYLSWSPCANCSQALVQFLQNNANIKLRIFVSRLYRTEVKENRKGLQLLSDAGVPLRVMKNKDFEYCWKTFVDHQQSPFPPWYHILGNQEHYQEELSDILQQNDLGAQDGVCVLIVGTSMVRHVKISRCSISCHPGAHVEDVNDVIPRLLAQQPSVIAVVAHVGTWDHNLQQSEKLKNDYISLVRTIQDTKKRVIVSGPFVPPWFGEAKFSRVRQLHIWLKGYCCSGGIPYVDNFTTFLNRRDLFKPDLLHPNLFGSRLLAMNIELTLLSCNAFSK
ncbi:DNA dC-_dU-editing enzyme APOBEC-3G-like isoform X1 [Hippocampus zosterae]|uniref:DNA dC->dU-editing enzyme APOBEC-3G-like isoform X1 n=1 Tax=Hippocampus zosterae TaxID=109293 RepID=UPI00223E1035|nr:DNA dC->dU-editing enzyme APOBEC-3G-like isoform X1 [Hippocampus zosterae]